MKLMRSKNGHELHSRFALNDEFYESYAQAVKDDDPWDFSDS